MRTDHFSFWFMPDWDGQLQLAKARALDRLDAALSVTTADKHPQCAGEAEARRRGYQVLSDNGRRVYWCLGIESDEVVLKTVNGRGYGTSAEYTPGLAIKDSKANDLVGTVASFIKSPPSRRDNSVALMASGDQITYSVTGSSTMGVMVRPDAGAYLLTALQFGVDTLLMVADRVGASPTKRKLLAALQASQCLQAMTEMASTDLEAPSDVVRFFKSAIDASFDCVGDVVEDIDLGPINNLIVAPLLWLFDGVNTAVQGVVAGFETLDTSGYQITVTPPASPPTEQQVIDPFTSSGLKPGWTIDRSGMASGSPIDCDYDPGSLNAVGPSTHSCGTTADSANACWTAQVSTAELWCVNSFDLDSRELRAVPATNVNDDTPTPAKPKPLFLELSDGSRWFYRIGGAWDAGPAGFEPIYGCLNKVGICAGKNERGYYRQIVSDGSGIDDSQPTWRVHVGETGSPTDPLLPPVWMEVRTAWFIAGHRWHGH